MTKIYYRKRNGELYTDFTKKEILNQIDITKPDTFLPFLEEMDYPFFEELYNDYLKYEKNFSFPKYIARMRLMTFKNFGYKDSRFLNKNQKLTNDEIRYKFYLPNTKFYGRMYGNKYITIYKNNEIIRELDKILEIDKSDIHFCENEEAFWYRWGGPGPDINLYYFKDYGETWAFSLEDLEKEEVNLDIN